MLLQIVNYNAERASVTFKSHAEFRGKTTIPMAGIDVPFLSRKLRPGVDAFREVLENNFPLSMEGVAVLEHRYIPNLVAKPFELTTEFVELARAKSGSTILAQLLGCK